MSSAEVSGSETPGQKAARLRREKRQNKAQGEERLAKIKQLNGGIAPPTEALGGPQPVQVSDVTDDPDEADISSTAYGGRPSNFSTGQMPTNDEMLQSMMRLQAMQGQQPGHRLPGPQPSKGQDVEDPMAKMMQQLMGMAGDPIDPNNVHNTQDPMQMLSALMGAQRNGQGAAPVQASSSTYLWRIVHAVFAVFLAAYIATTSTFDGSLLARTQSSVQTESSGLGHRLFIIFVTAELALQSTRFFLEGGQLQGSGMLASISQIAPEPFATYVRSAGRWISILGSIFSDAMVVIFVLGVMAWWNGSAAS